MAVCIHAGTTIDTLLFPRDLFKFVLHNYCRYMYLLVFYLVISVQPCQEIHIMDIKGGGEGGGRAICVDSPK